MGDITPHLQGLLSSDFLGSAAFAHLVGMFREQNAQRQQKGKQEAERAKVSNVKR